MKRVLEIAIVLLFLFTYASGQEPLKLKPLKEKQMLEMISPAEKKGKWGFANENGKFLINPVFEQVEEFKLAGYSESGPIYLAKVRHAGKWGFLSRNGVFLVEPKYDELSDFNHESSIFREGDEYGLLSCEGLVLYNHIQELDQFNANGQAWFKADGLWGVILRDGKILFPNIYTAKATEHLTENLLKTVAGDKYGIISFSPDWVILEPIYDTVSVDQNCNKIIIYSKDGRFGFVSNNGTYAVEPMYDKIKTVSKNNSEIRILVKKDGKYGVVDNRGQEVIPMVFNTDQFDGRRQAYKFFEESPYGYKIPAFYYEDKRYDIHSLDDLHFKKDRRLYTYEFEKAFDIPMWMKRHIYEDLGEQKTIDMWASQSQNVFFPDITSENIIKSEMFFDDWSDSYMVLDKQMHVIDSKGFEYYDASQVSSVKILTGDESYACGDFLATLFRSVDAEKITKYDNSKGTRILYDWSSITLRIPVWKAYNENLHFVVVDMYIDDRHMQRTVAFLDKRGEVVNMFQGDGVLYDMNEGLDPDELLVHAIEDYMTVTSVSLTTEFPRTAVYIGEMHLETFEDFVPIQLFKDGSEIYMVGTDSSMKGRVIILHDDLSYSDRGVVYYDFETELLKYSAGICFVFDQESGIFKRSCKVSDPEHVAPALRYTISSWDGENIVALSKNHWDDISKATWYYIPKAQNKVEDSIFNIGDVTVSVSPANAWGYSVYKAKYTNSSDESYRYGFMGFDKNFFTMPVFEDAKWTLQDKVSVKINGEWVDLTIGELDKFTAKYGSLYDDSKDVQEEKLSMVKPLEKMADEEAIPLQLIEVKPRFQGGDANQFSKWVNQRLVYPDVAKKNGVQGRVTLQFTVEKDGSVTKVKVLRGADPSLDIEAIRVVSMSPKWTPGTLNGKPVRVTYTFPVIFQSR